MASKEAPKALMDCDAAMKEKKKKTLKKLPNDTQGISPTMKGTN